MSQLGHLKFKPPTKFRMITVKPSYRITKICSYLTPKTPFNTKKFRKEFKKNFQKILTSQNFFTIQFGACYLHVDVYNTCVYSTLLQKKRYEKISHPVEIKRISSYPVYSINPTDFPTTVLQGYRTPYDNIAFKVFL